MKKKILSVFAIICLCSTLIACAEEEPTTNESNIVIESSVETEDNTVKQEETISSETIDSAVVETETDIITETEISTEVTEVETETVEIVPETETTSESEMVESEPSTEVIEPKEPVIETPEVEEPEVIYTYTNVSKVVYAIETVGMYDVPTSDGNKLGSTTITAPYEVTGVCNETGWYRIVLGENTIFASADAFANTMPNAESEMSNENNNSTSDIPNSSLGTDTGSSDSSLDGTPSTSTGNNNTSTETGNNGNNNSSSDIPDSSLEQEQVPVSCTHAYNFYKEEILNLRYEAPLEGGCEDTVCTYNFFCSNCHTLMKTEVEHHVAHMSKVLTVGYHATCTTDGLEGTSSCGCGALPIIGGKVIPAKGHFYKEMCTGELSEDGYKVKYVSICVFCDDIQSEWWDF